MKTVQPLLELQSGGTFVIEKFPDVMMVDGGVSTVSVRRDDTAEC